MANAQFPTPPSTEDERIPLDEYVKQYFENQPQTHAHALLRDNPDMPLRKIPEISRQYVKEYVSPDSQVALRDPQTFTIRPPAWQRWSASRYRRLYEFVAENLNLLPFAEQENLSLEEVQLVFDRTIGHDFENKSDKIKSQKDSAVLNLLKQTNDHAMPFRQWTEKGVTAYLKEVRKGVVELVSPEGSRVLIRRKRLIEDDLIFIKKHATGEVWDTLQEDHEKPDDCTMMMMVQD